MLIIHCFNVVYVQYGLTKTILFFILYVQKKNIVCKTKHRRGMDFIRNKWTLTRNGLSVSIEVTLSRCLRTVLRMYECFTFKCKNLMQCVYKAYSISCYIIFHLQLIKHHPRLLQKSLSYNPHFCTIIMPLVNLDAIFTSY